MRTLDTALAFTKRMIDAFWAHGVESNVDKLVLESLRKDIVHAAEVSYLYERDENFRPVVNFPAVIPTSANRHRTLEPYSAPPVVGGQGFVVYGNGSPVVHQPNGHL
jgi:hypothetical protein